MDLKLKDNSELKLLGGVIRLEYLECVGEGKINTNIDFINGLSVLIDISQIQNFPNHQWLYTFITRTADNGLSIGWDSDTSATRRIVMRYGGKVTSSFYFPLNERHTIEVYSNGSTKELRYDGDTVGTVTDSQVISGNTIDIEFNNTTLPHRYYNICIRDKNYIKILDLIPAVDGNNIPCMYDTISKTFFYNSGTGNFIAGPVVDDLPENIFLKTTTFYHKNTPNVDGLQLLNGILYVQEAAEDVVLNRIRVDIGNVSGSLSELMQYSGMSGFNDNYEPQTKPRLVGTWTINDWYTTDQLNQARQTFDGLTIVENSNYVIDFSQMAVQVLDPNEDNYNPAVAIILQGHNLGTTITDAPLGYGRWFMSKSQAAAVTSVQSNPEPGRTVSWFANKDSVTDTNNILDGNSHYFVSFDVFKYFTGVLNLYSDQAHASFCIGNAHLERITLPPQIHYLPWGAFEGCTSLTSINIQNITGLSYQVFARCGLLNLDDISHITNISAGSFSACASATFTTINSSVTNINENGNIMGTFSHTTSIPYLHFLSETPVTEIICSYDRTHVYNSFYGTSYKIYVGDGSSALHDQEILAAYKHASNWSGMVSYLGSWYDFAIPHLTYDGEYVTITVQRESTIYYTTDGTTPTTESMEYTEPFSWNGQGVIKTMATNSYNDVVYAPDFYSTTVENPEITINTTTKQITLSSTTSGITIYYTLDGSYPTLNSSIYSGPIDATELEDIVKVRCFAIKSGMNNSEVVSKICVMDDSLWGTDGDSSYFAVQCIDSSKPNYNPAVCIILNNNNKLTDKCYGVGGYINKTDAANITSIGTWFKSKTNVTDTNGIVTFDTTATYQFTDFDVFQYFSGVTVGCALQGSSGVKYITLPPNFTRLNSNDWWGIHFIRVILNEIAINLSTTWDVAYQASIQNLIYKSIEQASKFKLVENGDRAIRVNNVYVNDTLLTELTIDDSITDIGYTKVLGTSLTKIILHNNITKVNISNTSVSTVGLAGSGADIEFPTSVITFGPSKSLTSLELPSSITNLSQECFYNKSVGPQDILTIPSGVTVIPSYCFSGMTGIKIIELQGNVTKFGELAFYTGSGYVHLCGTTIPTIVYPEYYSRKTYVGLGQSQAEDEALLATFRADSTWSSKNLDTWYNYLHPQS